MRIILLCILIMRTGTEAHTLTSSSATETLISTTIATIEEELHSATFRSSDTEVASESLELVTTKKDSLLLTAVVIETSSPYLVSTVTPIAMLVSESIVNTQPNEPTEIREIISSVLLSTTLTDRETVSPFIVSPEMKTISHIMLSSVTNTSNLHDEVSVTASLTDILSTTIAPSPTSSIVDQETSSFNTSASKLTSMLRKASAITDIPKVIRNPSYSPVVVAKRCCKDQHHLDNNKCVANTNLIQFEPLSNIKMGSEINGSNFSWETEMLNCSTGFKLQEFNLDGDEATLKFNKTEFFLKFKVFFITRTTSSYCIDQQANGNYLALVCVPDIQTLCDDVTCIIKCCAVDEVMSHTICKKDTRVFSPTYYTIKGDETPAPEDIKVVSQVPQCPFKSTMTFSKMPRDPYYLLSTGKLYLKKKGKALDITHYCIDYYPEAEDEVAAYCVDRPSPVQEWKIFLFPITYIISIIFLIMIVICHLLSRHLRNVQGLCFLAYSMALLMSYFGFLANFKYMKQMNSGYCVFNAIFSQFSLLSAFFWLSVMCFDIWRVIRATVKCIPLSGILENDAQKFLLYSAYAFGCPVVIGVITLIMQYLPEELSSDLIVPGFEKESCWFVDDLSQFLYFYLIIALLNGISLALLGHILFMLFQAEQGFGCFFRKESDDRAFNRKHLALFRQRLSLFAVMAICWFTEVLSLKIPPKDMWVVTDLLNTLQGVIVFIIFISSKKKRGLVKDAVVIGLTNLSSNVPTKSTSVEEDTVVSTETVEDNVVSTQSTETVEENSGNELVSLPCASQGPSNRESNQTPVEERHKEEEEEEEEEKGGGIVNNGFEFKDDVDFIEAKRENNNDV